MKGARVLIVEDEGIVAMEIKDRLQGLGYVVVGIASSGEEAIQKAVDQKPDLVLMDIILKGEMDGVEAADRLRKFVDLPLIYLTAYSDNKTLQRAKVTEPFGYILKPFEERELQTAIEIAIYKHEMEKKLRESRQWLATTLRSIGDAVIATDEKGRIAFINPVAEEMTGWKHEEALGKDLSEVFRAVREDTGEMDDDPVSKALMEGSAVRVTDQNILISRDDRETPIDESISPLRSPRGDDIGVVLVFRDTTERRQAEIERKIKEMAMESAVNAIAITDMRGRIKYANISFMKLWGYERGEILGRQASETWGPKAEMEEVDEALKDMGHWIGEMIAIRKDGTAIDVQMSSSIVTDKLSRPIYIMNSFIDITELKHAQTELKRYTAKLERADTDLEELSERASRDLEESISVLQEMMETLSRDYEGVLDEKTKRSLKEAKDAMDGICSLLEDILTHNVPIALYISLIELYQAKIHGFKGLV